MGGFTHFNDKKAIQKDIVISGIRLLRKHGGESGDFIRSQEL